MQGKHSCLEREQVQRGSESSDKLQETSTGGPLRPPMGTRVFELQNHKTNELLSYIKEINMYKQLS